MFLPRRYRIPKLFLALLIIELPFTVALLALFGIASPDTYRTRLWQDGADNGFNSDPNLRVYAYANFRSYDTPLAWTSLYVSTLYGEFKVPFWHFLPRVTQLLTIVALLHF